MGRGDGRGLLARGGGDWTRRTAQLRIAGSGSRYIDRGRSGHRLDIVSGSSKPHMLDHAPGSTNVRPPQACLFEDGVVAKRFSAAQEPLEYTRPLLLRQERVGVEVWGWYDPWGRAFPCLRWLKLH